MVRELVVGRVGEPAGGPRVGRVPIGAFVKRPVQPAQQPADVTVDLGVGGRPRVPEVSGRAEIGGEIVRPAGAVEDELSAGRSLLSPNSCLTPFWVIQRLKTLTARWLSTNVTFRSTPPW